MPLLVRMEYAVWRKERGLAGGHYNAVCKAIRDGIIKVDRYGMIDTNAADKDWIMNTPVHRVAPSILTDASVQVMAEKKVKELLSEELNAVREEDFKKLEESKEKLEESVPFESGKSTRRQAAEILYKKEKSITTDTFVADYNVARARKEFFESELARLKYEERTSKLIPSIVVKKLLFEAGKIIAVGHADIVAQLAPDLASETSIHLVERLLKKALDNLDNDLSVRIASLGSDILKYEDSTPEDEEDGQ